MSHLQLDNESGSKVLNRSPYLEPTIQPPNLFQYPQMSTNS